MEIKPDEYEDYLKEEYLSVREAAEMLEISEDELRLLAHENKIPSHNIAGVFLRLKKKEVEDLKNKWRIGRDLFPGVHERLLPEAIEKPSFREKLSDLWYFNDFYVICSIIIVGLLYLIISSQ